MVELDKFDKKILFELDKDSSMSLARLSKVLGRSKQFVLFRMQKLEQEKIILGYNAIVDMSKLGYFTFRVYIDLQNMGAAEEAKFVEFIKKNLPNVWTITRMHGKWDYALFIGVKDISQFHETWDKLLLHYKKTMKAYKIAVYAPIYNFNRVFFTDKENLEPVERIYGAGKVDEVDAFDLELLHLYGVDARQSFLELSRKLKSSHDKIRDRIAKLEKKGVIVGYKLDLNLEKLGFQGYRVDLELNSTKSNKEIFNFCRNHKYIYQINKSIGGADFEIEVIVRDLTHLNELINEIKARFKEEIKDVEYLGFSAFYSLKFIPD